MYEWDAQHSLSTKEKEQFHRAGLLKLYLAMQKPADEEIAKEAVKNYDEDKQQTTIKGEVVQAMK